MAKKPVTLSCEGEGLECENQVGSLNSTLSTPAQVGTTTSGVNTGAGGGSALQPYVPPELCIGTWQITGNDSQCAINEAAIQASYVAESLNISGAPINVYPLLGVHQQGKGSVLADGMIIGSQPAPGYPLSGINTGPGWRSVQSGTNVVGSGCYVGIDFGIKRLTKDDQQSEYNPAAAKWTDVGCVVLTQSNNPGFFATQVRVETATGDVQLAAPVFAGTGNGSIVGACVGDEIVQCTIMVRAMNATTFGVFVKLPTKTLTLGTAIVGQKFYSTFISFTIQPGGIQFATGDMFTIAVNYVWCRAGVFNVIQSPSPQQLNLNTKIKVKAIRVIPIMFTGTGNWEVDALDFLDGSPTNINNIQDLFFNENRDRDYNTTPIQLKCAYTPTDSLNDLSKFGLSILDQYVFTCSFAVMVQSLGRPIVVGDIIEVVPELQYDQNLLPIRKFLDVTDCGWASSGFSPAYLPMVYRFTAQQSLPSQENRDIFGTMNTQKYMTSDAIFTDGIGQQVDTTPLTRTEEITKEAANKVPETGSDDNRSVEGVVIHKPAPRRNDKGQPRADTRPDTNPNIYIEDGLPPNGEPYGEGFKLPDTVGVADGAYFRLYYPPTTQIPPRLHKFSAVLNRWQFMETDRRGTYTSLKPSQRKIMESPNRVPLNKKQT